MAIIQRIRCSNPKCGRHILDIEAMRNGTMFAGLRGYREQAFCKSHPIIEIETTEECGYYSVFAVLTVKKGWLKNAAL